MENKIVVETVTASLAQLETALSTLSNHLNEVSNVSTTLSSAWESENATIVKNQVQNIFNNLTSLNSSVSTIKSKVNEVVQATVKSDTVHISGGVSGMGSASNSFNQNSVRN